MNEVLGSAVVIGILIIITSLLALTVKRLGRRNSAIKQMSTGQIRQLVLIIILISVGLLMIYSMRDVFYY